MPRRPRPQPPLPPRDGLGAARVRMPPGDEGRWAQHLPDCTGRQPFATVVEFLVHLTGDEAGVWRRVRAGEVRLADGTAVGASTPYKPGGSAYLYRDLPEEVPVPGVLSVLLRDDDTGLLAVDKPPFLATMPRGSHVAQTVLVRLRRELDLPDLSPVHRLDRLTSGVLLLATRREARAPYQRLVQAGGLAKTYEALAPVRDDLALPRTVSNRLVKSRGHLQTRVEQGRPNAVTRVELVGTTSLDGREVGRYRLTPTTGQTHQLRVHLAGLGIPILGDPLYPDVRAVVRGDFSQPLQLLAQQTVFDDPVSGTSRRVTTRRSLPVLPLAPP